MSKAMLDIDVLRSLHTHAQLLLEFNFMISCSAYARDLRAR